VARVGLVFNGPPYSAETMIATTARAEATGFDSVWQAEDPFGPDAISLLGAYAQATSTVRLGTALINIHTRHPAIIAATFANLDQQSRGRMVLGIGTGLSWLQYMGLTATDVHPVADMTRAIDLMRDIWSRDDPLFDGKPAYFWGRRSSLLNAFNWPWGGFAIERPRIPIYVGARGPRMIELTAKVADGLIVEHSLPTQIVQQWVARYERALLGVGRARSDVETVGLVMLSVSADGTPDPSLFRYLAGLLARSNVAEDASRLELEPTLLERIKRLWTEGQEERAARLIDPATLARFGAYGNVEQCVQRLAEYRSAGLDVPLIFPQACDLQLVLDVGRRYAELA
jgi:5,10-methylenetetrahydromethanopterin reductase